MRYYLIAGEASGDLHGAGLMKEIRKNDPAAEFRCWGGDLMQAAGGELVKHYRDLAYMGFAEVVMNLGTIMKNLELCRKDILKFRPDALILIDYPGFNLRMASFAHSQGIRVVYYISPQVWAWKKSRVYSIRKNVDKMLVILPFEEEFYRKYDYKVEFVGHPLLDVISGESRFTDGRMFREACGLSDKPLIALLPGSRKQEIRRMLPVMAGLAGKFPAYEFVAAGAPAIDPAFYRDIIGDKGLKVIYGQTHELLRWAYAAAVTSGTATLETALSGVPQVVCYCGSAVSYAIAKRLVKVKFISLVNLIMDRQVVTELIQKDFSQKNLEAELQKILQKDSRKQILADYNRLREKLGGHGAARRAAEKIAEMLNVEG